MTLVAEAPAFGVIEMREHAQKEPGEVQLLIRFEAKALCSSDRGQLLHGSSVVRGHEASGTVLQAGPGTRTPVAAHGVVHLMDFCGTCRGCRFGATNQCLAKRADMGFTNDGGLAGTSWCLSQSSPRFTTRTSAWRRCSST